MEFLREDHAIVLRNQEGKMIAEITYKETDNPNVVDADHTYTADELRGQGVAGQLLDELVKEMKQTGKKILPTCPYVVRKFDQNPDQYGEIDARI